MQCSHFWLVLSHLLPSLLGIMRLVSSCKKKKKKKDLTKSWQTHSDRPDCYNDTASSPFHFWIFAILKPFYIYKFTNNFLYFQKSNMEYYSKTWQIITNQSKNLVNRITYPWYVACMRAVQPLIVSCLSISQPLSTSNWAMSNCPAMAANIRGVAPSSGEHASLWLGSWSNMARILLMSPEKFWKIQAFNLNGKKGFLEYHLIRFKPFLNHILTGIKYIIPNFIASIMSGFFSSAATNK